MTWSLGISRSDPFQQPASTGASGKRNYIYTLNVHSHQLDVQEVGKHRGHFSNYKISSCQIKKTPKNTLSMNPLSAKLQRKQCFQCNYSNGRRLKVDQQRQIQDDSCQVTTYLPPTQSLLNLTGRSCYCGCSVRPNIQKQVVQVSTAFTLCCRGGASGRSHPHLEGPR